ncbi:MAG: hypothetical protein IH987_09080, partial [Planctomycetes bacterium]|nr:hypothetical protein [Planctomycetota bacterium]
RAGANRLAFVFFIVTLAGWSLEIHHVASLFGEFSRLVIFTGWAMLVSTTVWLLYVGLEPYVRRRWPQVLIGWSRLLSGRFRDPLVGRDVLIGGATAILAGAVDRVSDVILASAGAPPDAPASGGLVTLLGARYLLGSLLDISATWFALFLLFMLFSLRVVLRREWLAVIALLVIFSVPNLLNVGPGFTMQQAVLKQALNAIGLAILVLLLVRFGLLSMLSFMLIGGLLNRFHLTFDPSVWYSGTTFVVFALVVGIYGFACHTALAGRSLFKDEMLDG